jgi:hypothetical protein
VRRRGETVRCLLCCGKNINEANAPSTYTFKKFYPFFTFEEAWIGHVEVA